MRQTADPVLTFILAGGRGQRLEPLTAQRPKPAIPAGGSYKLIDFTLSNCLNSGLSNIGVLVQHLSAELIRYVHEGWRPYFPSTRGENIQAIPPQYAHAEQGYRGTADALYQNLHLVQHAEHRVVLVLSGDHIYKMDYRELLRFHEACGADLTVGTVEVPVEEGSQFGVMEVDHEGLVRAFEEKPRDPAPVPGNPGLCLASMGVYAFNPVALPDILGADAHDDASAHDLGRDIVPRMVRSHRVCAFRFADASRNVPPYWRDVGTLESYYQANMDLIAVNPELNLYDAEWPIRTAPIPAPPPKFVHHEPHRTGVAIDSIVSPGCIVSGARVVHSVIGPEVRLHSWALVEDSILFARVDVGRHTKVRRAILEDDVVVPPGTEVGYDLDGDRRRFVVTDSGIVVVSREAAESAWKVV